jgi:hypothetical protein
MQREFIEIAPYTWWYLVADLSGRTLHPTWRTPMKAYGPFQTKALAERDLDERAAALILPIAA